MFEFLQFGYFSGPRTDDQRKAGTLKLPTDLSLAIIKQDNDKQYFYLFRRYFSIYGDILILVITCYYMFYYLSAESLNPTAPNHISVDSDMRIFTVGFSSTIFSSSKLPLRPAPIRHEWKFSGACVKVLEP